MRALVVGLVCAGALGWVLVGLITMLKHNREKRRAFVQLQGHYVELEFRIGRTRRTQQRAAEPVKQSETIRQGFFCASFSMVGLLIHAAVGSLGGVGRRWRKRAGLAA